MYRRDIMRKVAKELNLSIDVVSKVYSNYWKFIQHTLQEMPLKPGLTKEEFSKLRPNFNIPALGKLFCTYEHYSMIEKTKKKNDSAKGN